MRIMGLSVLTTAFSRPSSSAARAEVCPAVGEKRAPRGQADRNLPSDRRGYAELTAVPTRFAGPHLCAPPRDPEHRIASGDWDEGIDVRVAVDREMRPRARNLFEICLQERRLLGDRTRDRRDTLLGRVNEPRPAIGSAQVGCAVAAVTEHRDEVALANGSARLIH